MKITIISGSLQSYVDGEEEGNISISEPCTDYALQIAEKFLSYGKTVVLEIENAGE